MPVIPKKNRVAIYSYLFKEGVMVAKESQSAPKHMELDVPNLHVVCEMKSLKSRGYITQQFNWGHYYWYLTNEGIEFLRSYLHLPDEIVPATLKKPKPTPRAGGAGPRGDRDGERRGPPRGRFDSQGPEGDKKVGPGAGFQPRYAEGGSSGGFGRGRAGGYGERREGSGGFGGRPGYRTEGSQQGGESRPFGRGRA